jgi:hypothetical protein
MEDSVSYVVRTQGNAANQYGLGKVISDHVALFEAGNYDLTWDQLQAKLKQLPKTKGNR